MAARAEAQKRRRPPTGSRISLIAKISTRSCVQRQLEIPPTERQGVLLVCIWMAGDGNKADLNTVMQLLVLWKVLTRRLPTPRRREL